jgi:hypothetical protein
MCAGQNNSSSHWDFDSKKEQLASFLGAAACLPPDTELHALLQSNDFNVDQTAEALLSQPVPNEMERSNEHSPPNEHLPPSPPGEKSGKRPRAEQAHTSHSQAGSSAQSPTMADVFMTTAMMGNRSAAQSEVHMDTAYAALLLHMQQLKLQLDSLQKNLPKEVAKAVPPAVRAYDEEVNMQVQQKVLESSLGGTLAAIRDAGTMSALGKIEGFRFNPHENTLSCICCEAYASFSGLQNAKGAGSIEGPDFSRADARKDSTTAVGRVRRPLQIVKESMKVHLCGQVHCWCSVHAAERAQRDREKDEAAILCGRLVLQNIKEHDSDSSYERRLAGAKVAGSDVGSKNASRKFVPKLRASMHAVLIEGFMKLLTTACVATGRLPAFAAMADKATVNGTTGQMHGIVVMVEGVLVAIFLSVLVAADGTGNGLALVMEQMLMGGLPLTLTADVIRCSMTGCAFDGQYQGEHEGHAAGLQVIDHLCEHLNLSGKWVISRWDGAHRIELGMDTVRKKVAWYGNLAGVVSNTSTKYLYGKGHERVKQAFQSLKDRLKPAAIGVICTSRFCHSERKVYKNFFRNLVVFISDMRSTERANEVGIDANISAVANVVFVIHLAGIIDVLQHVKNLSLVLQTVNVLPWELEEHISNTTDLLDTLAADLAVGNISRALDPTDRSNGDRVPAFEFLSIHMSELKQMKLSLRDPRKPDDALQTIDLSLNATRRASRISNPLQAMMGAAAGMGARNDDPTHEIDKALKDVSECAKITSSTLWDRLQPPEADRLHFRMMRACLDFRKMAFDSNYANPEAKVKEPLRRLHSWLAMRFTDHRGGPIDLHLNDMPSLEVVWLQFLTLHARLLAASDEHPFKTTWKNASGTVIMKDVFTRERYYSGCRDYLYIFQHCATKTMCEAVVEGMGGCWDQSSGADRHPSFESGIEEAVIAWSAPQPYHAVANAFVAKSLTHLFGSGYASHFHHVDKRVSRIKVWAGGAGKVISRLMQEKPRLPSVFYQ